MDWDDMASIHTKCAQNSAFNSKLGKENSNFLILSTSRRSFIAPRSMSNEAKPTLRKKIQNSISFAENLEQTIDIGHDDDMQPKLDVGAIVERQHSPLQASKVLG